MIKKIMMLHIFLAGLYGVVHGALQPITNGQIITLNLSEKLTSLSFLSSDGQTTALDIMTRLSENGLSIRGYVKSGVPLTFVLSASEDQSLGAYGLQLSTPGSPAVYIDTLKGKPTFEIYANGVTSGYYIGEDVAQFTMFIKWVPSVESAPIPVAELALNSLTVVSSDNQTTTLDIITPLSTLNNASVQASFSLVNPIRFALIEGENAEYGLYVEKILAGGVSGKDLLGVLKGKPNFEMYCNGLPIGGYFGPDVPKISILKVYPAITITTADATTNSCYSGSTYPCPYVAPNLGQYFTEITAMSFVQASGAANPIDNPVEATQIAEVNAYYQKMRPNSEVSIRVVHTSTLDKIYLLMENAAPYLLCSLSNTQGGIGYPVALYINNVLVATVEAVMKIANKDGNLFAVLKK